MPQSGENMLVSTFLAIVCAAQLAEQENPAELYGERWTQEAQVYRSAGPSVVQIDVFAVQTGSVPPVRMSQAPISQGTGVVIDPSGLVITNAHLVSPTTTPFPSTSFECDVTFAEEFGGKTFTTQTLSLDREWDLALLKINSAGAFRAIPLGNSDDLIHGEKVITIGTPYGNSHSITSGILSGVHRNVEVENNSMRGRRQILRGLLQTDAAINPGNSGGPLLNIYGHLVGINTATLRAADGIAFAVPVNRVREILDERLLVVDYASRFWVGLRVGENKDGQLVVDYLHPRGPAANADIQDQDRMLAVNDHPVSTRQDYASILLSHSRGDIVRFTVQTEGQAPRDAEVRLRTATSRDSIGLLGFQARRAYLPVQRSAFQTRNLAVLKITRVFRNTGAEALGLKEGDLIVAVKMGNPEGEGNWQPVGSFEELVNIVRGPGFVRGADNLWILRQDQSYRGELTFDDPDLIGSS